MCLGLGFLADPVHDSIPSETITDLEDRQPTFPPDQETRGHACLPNNAVLNFVVGTRIQASFGRKARWRYNRQDICPAQASPFRFGRPE